METAAAALGVIAFALQGTRNIYETLRSIRDVPNNVQQLSLAVARLRTTLEQLRDCRALTNPRVNATDLDPLLDLVQHCRNDIQGYQETLRKVHSEPSDSKAKKTWRRLGTFFSNRDLANIHKAIDDFNQQLQTQLSLLQINTEFTTQDRVLEIHDASATQALSDLRHTSLLEEQGQNLSNFRDTLQSIHRRVIEQSDHIEKQTGLLLHQNAQVCSINEGVQSLQGLRVEQQSNQQCSYTSAAPNKTDRFDVSLLRQFRDSMNSISEKVDRISNTVSSAQSQDIMVLMKAIEARLPALSESEVKETRPETTLPVYEDSKGSSGSVSDGNAELESCLSRFYKLVAHDGANVRNEEAEVIIDDLNTLLKSLMEAPGPVCGDPSKRKRDPTDEATAITPRDFKKLCSTINGSDSIEVNHRRQRMHGSSEKRISKSTKFADARTDKLRAELRLTERSVLKCRDRNNESSNKVNEKEIIAKLKAYFQNGRQKAVLHAEIRCLRMLSGYSVLCPTITIGRTLGFYSRIFEVVSDGDVDALRLMLANREATLWDRDEDGTSLLFYGVSSPEMCKFLIENGADLDDKGRIDDMGWEGPILNAHHYRHRYIDEEPKSLRILLAAGADPCCEDNVEPNTLWWLIDDYTKQRGESILFQLFEYADNFDHDIHGIRGYSSRIDVLVKAGVDITIRNRQGETALHAALNRIGRSWYVHDAVGIIASLIHHGSDVYSKDKHGLSLSNLVYTLKDFSTHYRWAGEIWDAALATCGYDIRVMRSGYPRGPFGAEDSNRDIFEAYWRGIEHLCPYFDNPPFWCPHVPQETEQDGGHSKSIVPVRESIRNGKRWFDCEVCGYFQEGWYDMTTTVDWIDEDSSSTSGSEDSHYSDSEDLWQSIAEEEVV